MSKFENMNAKEIAICLEAFYEASQKYSGTATLAGTTVYFRSGKEPIHIYRSDYDEGIKILREDYEVFWTPDTKPDDLKWKINKRRMKRLQEHIAKNSWYEASSGVTFGPGCVVTGNDYWHSKYEKEHEECVRLSYLHVADKEKKDEQDAKIRDLSDQNATLGYSVAALKKKIRSMEAEATEKENQICQLEALVVTLIHDDKEDE